MIRTEHLLTDRQCTFEQSRTGSIIPAIKYAGEVIEIRRRIRMVGAEHLLADCQRALRKWNGLLVPLSNSQKRTTWPPCSQKRTRST
jgi:hypothetical protein